MEDKKLKTTAKVMFGGDPELFITLDGKVVGSERAIAEDGLNSEFMDSMYSKGQIKLIRDGVQVELNLPPTYCRSWFAMEVGTALKSLHKHIEAMKISGKQFEVSFRQVVDVDRAELDALSKESRRLGCNISYNWYSPKATIGVDPDTYTKRSAGGHIHLGLPDNLKPERERLAPILDVLLGNTSVLIDRDLNAAERRLVYGRAGEFRLPRHGFEYRTLSNFWIRSKELVGLVLGLTRLAVYVLDTSTSDGGGGWPADQVLMDLVKLRDIEKAINTNDLTLARSNFEGVKEFIRRHHPNRPASRHETGVDGSLLEKFDIFIDGIDKDGIEKWFPGSPLTHGYAGSFLAGWENWLERQCSR